MKKSEKYYLAMLAVLNDDSCLSTEDKLDIIEALIDDKRLAEFSERQEVGEAK